MPLEPPYLPSLFSPSPYSILLWSPPLVVNHRGGMAAALYSGISRPDMNLKPHALQRVLGPRGPVSSYDVFSDAQCMHRHVHAGLHAHLHPRGAGALLAAAAAGAVQPCGRQLFRGREVGRRAGR
ncbi:hypothetical protein DAI22_09g022601 [Oryza sativa Japonica Group]|nr:hypothetical protein DAI22_09g022601 [Oryza sativa Japonica Group]